MLTSVEIKNFRSCRSTILEFNKSVSALVGKNGTGKTNILQCIERLAYAGIQSVPIRIETPVDEKPGDDGFSLRISLGIDATVFEYSVAAPPRHALDALYRGRFTVEEKLCEREGDSGPVELISRKGEEVKISGRESPIRISAFSYTIGALMSLLPASDPIRVRLEPISSFFSGISYYSLKDLSESSDVVSEKVYDEWARRVKDGLAVTESVNLRLLYMMHEDAEMFAEFQALIGPDGLDLVSRVELVSMPVPHVPGGAVA